MRESRESIERCVRASAKARDERGRWRQERKCAAELIALGASESIAKMTAAGSIAVGRQIADFVFNHAIELGYVRVVPWAVETISITRRAR